MPSLPQDGKKIHTNRDLFFALKHTDAHTRSIIHGFSSDFFFFCRTRHQVACNCSRKETIRLSCSLHSEKKQRGGEKTLLQHATGSPLQLSSHFLYWTLEDFKVWASGFMWLFGKQQSNRIWDKPRQTAPYLNPMHKSFFIHHDWHGNYSSIGKLSMWIFTMEQSTETVY